MKLVHSWDAGISHPS